VPVRLSGQIPPLNLRLGAPRRAEYEHGRLTAAGAGATMQLISRTVVRELPGRGSGGKGPSGGGARMEGQMSISHNQIEHAPIGQFVRRPGLRHHRTAPSVRTGVPWWTVATAGAAPALLVVGFLVAAMLQPVSYDSVRDTISALAARGAADPWVMTAAIAAVGTCYLVTALGLSAARRPGRLALAGAGIATLSIAAFPMPLHGYSRPHALAVMAASMTMCAWPLLAAHRQHRARLLTFGPNLAASVVTFGLIMWFTFGINSSDLGLAERCAAVMPALWLFPVTIGARRALVPDESVELDGGARVVDGPGTFVDLDRSYGSRRAAAL
jgi:hypothetical protein